MAIDPPTDVVAAAGSTDAWQPIVTDDDQAPSAWTAGELVVTRSRLGDGRAEAERLVWLEQRVPTAHVEAVASDVEADWVVTRTMGGIPALQIDRHGDSQGITATFATALRTLHDTPIDPTDFPFDSGWDDLAAVVATAVESLDPSTLPDPYGRYSAERLGEIWRDGRPEAEDLVLCHGNPSLSNLLVDPATVGWVGVGRLRLADRHLDLAIAQYSVHRNFGPDAVFAFFEAYDIDPDLVRLDHYLLAGLILS